METKVIQPTTGPSRQVISEANPDPAVRAWVHDQWMRDYLHARGMLWVLILRLITGMSGELIKTDETPNKEIPPDMLRIFQPGELDEILADVCSVNEQMKFYPRKKEKRRKARR
jgi:hypothetical protein